MKRITKLTIVAISAIITLSSNAENRWDVYAGGSISHLCEKPVIGSDKSYGWGGGAFLGAGYEISFDSRWSLRPQLEVSFINNGATASSKELTFYQRHSQSLQTWNINIPVLANYRLPLSSEIGLRFGAGPILQESVAGRGYEPGKENRVNLSGTFANRFNIGILGEAGIETGPHLSYFVRAQYPFLKEGWTRKTITLSAGIGFKF